MNPQNINPNFYIYVGPPETPYKQPCIHCRAAIERRYKQHVQCNGDNTFKNAWIQELQQQGLQPICRVVDTILGAHRARRTETDLIWDFIIAGESLFNHEDPFMPPEYRRDVK